MACFPAVLASGHCDCGGRGSGRQQRLANGRLDCRSRQYGSGVYCERAALWARALLPHRPLFPSDGPRRIVVRFGHPASRRERLEPARHDNPGRHHRPVVLAGDVSGKIPKGSLTISGGAIFRYLYGFKALLRSKWSVVSDTSKLCANEWRAGGFRTSRYPQVSKRLIFLKILLDKGGISVVE